MKQIRFRAWLVGTVFTSCTLGMAGPAFSQSSPPPTTPGAASLSTITVVARKKKEDLQKVPLSVTAITARTLKQAHVENLHDIAALTPGLNITDSGAETGTDITIRGVTDLTNGGNVPDVATFLDFTYLRDPQAINVAAIPLAQVEVVKGPVSALYGKDAYTGVINYIAARPTDTPHADISETAGDYGKSELQGDVSGPIYGDKVLGEVFGDFDTFQGTFQDKNTGAYAGGDLKKDIGALLDFDWSQHFTTHFDFYYGYDYFNSAADEALTPNCGPGAVPSTNGGFVTENTFYCGRIKSNGQVEVSNDPNAKDPGNERRVFYGSMHNTLSYDWGTIDAITGANEITSEAFQQFDGTSNGEPYLLALPTSPFVPDGNYLLKHEYFGYLDDTREVSQELRYSSPQDEPFRYGAGGFFDSETRTQALGVGLSDAGIPPGQVFEDNSTLDLFATPSGHPDTFTKSIQVSNEEAGFANAEYDILPNLTASTEYRYTWSLQTFTPLTNLFEPGVELGPHLTEANQYFSTNEALRWFPIPKQMLYFAFANGVKPGGFNASAVEAQDFTFGPETDLNYEGGFKTNLLGDRLQLDAAAYHIAAQNVQAYGPNSDPADPGTVIKNFGGTTNTGFEVDVRTRPFGALTLGGAFSYNDATFNAGSLDYADTGYCATIGPACTKKEVVGGNGLMAIPVAGNSVPFSPRYTLSATAEYDYLVLQQYPAYFRADYSFRSPEFIEPAELTSIGSASDLDAFAGVSKGRYTVSVYVKNITNDTTPEQENVDVQLNGFQDDPIATLVDGRTFAFTIAAKF